MEETYRICCKLNPWERYAVETDRLRLSVLRKSKATDVANYFVKNREFHQKWAQTHDENYYLAKTQKLYLKYDEKEFINGRLVPLWITLKDNPEQLIGRLSFFNFAYGGMMSCSTGYHLDKDFCGNGYMSEALVAGCDLLSDILKIHRVEAFILPENEKSINLITKCGFSEEGIRYSYMHINGSWRDHKSYYLLLE